MTLTSSLAEVAALIPCSERWLADRLRDGTFTAHKIAGSWRFTDDDIEAILAATEVSGQTPARHSEPITLTDGSRRALQRRRRRGSA
jgi:hypothetical protein